MKSSQNFTPLNSFEANTKKSKFKIVRTKSNSLFFDKSNELVNLSKDYNSNNINKIKSSRQGQS